MMLILTEGNISFEHSFPSTSLFKSLTMTQMGKCKKEPAVLFTFNGDHRHITLVDEKISLKPTSRERHRNIALLGLECEELKSESAT